MPSEKYPESKTRQLEEGNRFEFEHQEMLYFARFEAFISYLRMTEPGLKRKLFNLSVKRRGRTSISRASSYC
jgi:hypothetical protein